jgi:large subunit ribosomal protein L25
MYGHGIDAVSLTVDRQKLEAASRTGINAIFDLEGSASVAGKPVLIRELQRDPVSSQILHCDFFAVRLQEKVEVSIPVHIEGEPVGVKLQGGILESQLREIEVSCLPLSIPERIDVDVSELEIGDSIHVADLSFPEGVEVLGEAEQVVVHVVAPRVEEEKAVEEGEEAAAPAAGEAAAPAAEDGDND